MSRSNPRRQAHIAHRPLCVTVCHCVSLYHVGGVVDQYGAIDCPEVVRGDAGTEGQTQTREVSEVTRESSEADRVETCKKRSRPCRDMQADRVGTCKQRSRPCRDMQAEKRLPRTQEDRWHNSMPSTQAVPGQRGQEGAKHPILASKQRGNVRYTLLLLCVFNMHCCCCCSLPAVFV